MKKFIKEYLKIISYSLIGLTLVLTSFYLVMNYYHSEEVKRTIYIHQNDLNYQNYNAKLEQIKNNLNTYNSNKNKNNFYRKLYNKLMTCQTVMNGEGTLAKIQVNSSFSANDIYKIGTRFQSDILNICWAMHLSFLTEEDIDDEYKEIAPYIVSYINSITNQTSFALKELQNNSSYFYTTNITSSTVRNYLAADYHLIAKSYNDFADIILELSEKINDNGGNTND